ncbi:hypothetical protein ACOM2C_12930 [Pseudarthrobacter sp. So.54]
MSALAKELTRDGISLASSDSRGIDADFKESLMFALLGFLSWHGVACGLPATGPGRARVAYHIVPGPGPLRMPEPLAGIRGVRVLPMHPGSRLPRRGQPGDRSHSAGRRPRQDLLPGPPLPRRRGAGRVH